MRAAGRVTWQGWWRVEGKMHCLYGWHIELPLSPLLFFLFTPSLTSPVFHCLPNAKFREIFSALSNPTEWAGEGGRVRDRKGWGRLLPGMELRMGEYLGNEEWRTRLLIYFIHLTLYSQELNTRIWNISLQTQTSGNSMRRTCNALVCFTPYANNAWKRKTVKI